MSTPNDPTFGIRNQTKALRLALDWRQQELADRANLSTAAVSRFERNPAPSCAPLATVIAIARALNVSVDKLLGLDTHERGANDHDHSGDQAP